MYIYMDNPWKSSCSKKTKIYTIIQVSVYDLIWRSQSRFPQKYFCLKLLEHFKFIVHLSFITSLDMSGHFVCIQKNKVDGGGDWRIMKSGRNWPYFPSLKNCLKRGLCWKHFPKKKLLENPCRTCQEAGAPKGNSGIFHPKCFSYVCFREWVFPVPQFLNFIQPRMFFAGVDALEQTKNMKKTDPEEMWTRRNLNHRNFRILRRIIHGSLVRSLIFRENKKNTKHQS